MSAQRTIPTSSTVIMRRYIVIIQTPTTRLVFRSDTTCGSPTTRMLESSVAMKIPTVVTVRTTHLYSNNKPPRLLACPGFELDKYKTARGQQPNIPILKRHLESSDQPPKIANQEFRKTEFLDTRPLSENNSLFLKTDPFSYLFFFG